MHHKRLPKLPNDEGWIGNIYLTFDMWLLGKKEWKTMENGKLSIGKTQFTLDIFFKYATKCGCYFSVIFK